MTARTDYGFERTSCACRRCAISCEHVPGALSPADLPGMAQHLGYGGVEEFARENLLASEGVPVQTDRAQIVTLRTLVPATSPDGHCRFLAAGRCTIHEVSPFGCAFIDAHQSDAEHAARANALYRALHEDQQSHGPYAQVWEDLQARKQTAPPLEKRSYRLHKALRREGLL